jgi:ankyrin repeat protein
MCRMSTMLWIAWSVSVATAADDHSEVFRAIRNGDVIWLQEHISSANVEARDGRAATPLMHAAAFGNLQTMKLLIEKGADVNARNAFNATALLWCAREPEKAKLLIEKGADINAQSRQGLTPLIVAALGNGNGATVALLLDKGADATYKSSRGITALHAAGTSGDAESIRILLAKGANVHAADFLSRTPLFEASTAGEPAAIQALIQAGADVNTTTRRPSARAVPRTVNMEKNGLPNNTEVSPLHNAAAFGPVESVRHLLNAGARVNVVDSRGLTPLAFALASETPSIEIVRALLRAGADVNTADTKGETPLDWAGKFAFPDVMAELKKAGAKHGRAYEPPKRPDVPRPTVKLALERSIPLLEKTTVQFFQNSGCVACHTQSVIARAQASAKSAGLAVNDVIAKEQLQQLRAQWLSLQEEFLQGIVPGGGANRLADNLQGMHAAGYAPDSITDSAVVAIALSQEPDGHWGAGEKQLRPPIAQSHFAGTTRVIRMLQAYSIPARKQEFAGRIERARAWLRQGKPITTEDHTMKLCGLTWSGGSNDDINKAAKAVLALQRTDGGWGGNPHMPSDAYATAGALLALADSKVVKVTDSAYRKGIDYLLSTQFPDGAWHVRSRAIKFQPYFESGFPFGHDQWISVAATAFAAQAVALSVQSVTMSAQSR